MGINSSKRFKDEYKQARMIGKGAFAVVHLAIKRSDDRPFAAKSIKTEHLSRSALREQEEEVEIMRKLEHENIVKLQDVFKLPNKLIIVMEYCDGGHMLQRIVRKTKTNEGYTEAMAANMIKQIASAVQHMHANGIVHRDLKPENILYATKQPDSPIKITDFGLSKVLRHHKQKMFTSCGTPTYVAPEVVDPKQRGYNNKCDMWSIGVIMYVLLSGYPPFWGKKLPTLLKRIRKCEYNFNPKPFEDVPEEAKQIIRELLVLNPGDRLSATELLKKPWISGESHHRKRSRELRRASVHIVKFHNRKRFKQAIKLFIALDVLYKVAKGEKKYMTICGQRQFVDVDDCAPPLAKRRKLNTANKAKVSTVNEAGATAAKWTLNTASAAITRGRSKAVAGKSKLRRPRSLAKSYVNIDLNQAGSSI